MEKLVSGFSKFRTEVFGKRQELFNRLSQKQAPRALFITCSDSRVDPTLITQTEPGELFIFRNAGNLVPPYGSMQGGSTATIEYAMAVLKVPHIIVCGHTDCGVMKALLHPEEVYDLPAVKEWVGQAETTRRLMREHYTDLEGEASPGQDHPRKCSIPAGSSAHTSLRVPSAPQGERRPQWLGLLHCDGRCLGVRLRQRRVHLSAGREPSSLKAIR